MFSKIKCLLALSLLAGALIANEYEQETGGCFCEDQFRATLLFFKPTIDQNSYVITSDNNRFGGEIYPNGKRHLIHSKYKPGYRLEALTPLCGCPNNLLNLRFTDFQAHYSSTTSGPFLFDTFGYPGHGAQSPEDTSYAGTAKLSHNFKYYAGDLTINRPLFASNCDNFTFLLGIHTAYIRFKEHFRSFGTFVSTTPLAVSNDLHLKSTFWGIGPEVGVDYNYVIPCFCKYGIFALNANVRGILLASVNKAEIHDITNRTGPVGVNLKNNNSILRLNPACNAQLAFNFSCSLCNFNTFFEFGYEFVWYGKCINKITSYDIGFAGDTFDAWEDLSMQGPFVRLNIEF
jgi:hypothetical protein